MQSNHIKNNSLPRFGGYLDQRLQENFFQRGARLGHARHVLGGYMPALRLTSARKKAAIGVPA